MTEKESQELITNFAVLQEKMNSFFADTIGHRERLYKELKDLNLKITQLPCEMSILKLKEVDKFKANIDRILFYGIVSIIGIAVAWGSLQQRVSVNTLRLDKLESWRHATP